MEDLNKYMEKSTSSLSTIRSMVQEITDRKESYLSLDKVKILTATELEDNKNMTNVYHGLDEFFNKITIQSSTPIQSGQWLEIAQYQIHKEGNHAKI